VAFIQKHVDYIAKLPHQFQEAANELARQHLGDFAGSLSKMLEEGIYISMDESAELTKMLLRSHRRYLSVERAPFDPNEDWSPGYRKLWDSMASNSAEYVLLVNAEQVRSQHKRDGIKKIDDTRIYKMLNFMHQRNATCYYCDLNTLIAELGISIPFDEFFELFDDDIAILMDPLDNTKARGRGKDKAGFVAKQMKASVLILSEGHDIIRMARIIKDQREEITPELIRQIFLSE
jgi:hypothetical protein